MPKGLKERPESRDPVTAFFFWRPGIAAPLFLAALGCLAGCAAPAGEKAASASAPFCSASGLNVRTDFAAASLYACEETSAGPVFTIAPEFAPINPSPWYAYRLEREDDSELSRTFTIRHRYLHGQHRYSPWVKTVGSEWQAVSTLKQAALNNKLEFEFELEIPREGITVSAQPVLTVEDTYRWSDSLAGQHDLVHEVLASTEDGHNVRIYSTRPEKPQGMILLLGRQHPPEVTGAFAYQDFVDRLFENDGLARSFRQRFRLVLVPLVNPDGVARGHWRMNRGGTDLNRDWGLFTQPETRAIAAWLDTAMQETKLSLLLDFHSTWNDVIYSQHPSDKPTPSGFNQAWYEAIKNRLGDETPAWSGQHNLGMPTSKSWARREFGISAITYEAGDRTPRDLIRHKAEVSAEELMRILLSIEDPNS